VGSLASHKAALATERNYVLTTLSRSFLAGLVHGHWRRALTIVVGLAVTTAGYVHAYLSSGASRLAKFKSDSRLLSSAGGP
jgi:hypothetical protein